MTIFHFIFEFSLIQQPLLYFPYFDEHFMRQSLLSLPEIKTFILNFVVLVLVPDPLIWAPIEKLYFSGDSGDTGVFNPSSFVSHFYVLWSFKFSTLAILVQFGDCVVSCTKHIKVMHVFWKAFFEKRFVCMCFWNVNYIKKSSSQQNKDVTLWNLLTRAV